MARAKSKCRSCGADLKWLKTPKGKYMPCDPDGLVTVGGETVVSIEGAIVRDCRPGLFGYIPHWSTCPNADEHRKD